MNKKHLTQLILIILCLLAITGCNDVNPEEIASMIEISYPANREIPAGFGMDVQIKNNSDNCVIFPLVTGMAIYTEIDGKEVHVDNLIQIIGDENLYLTPKGEAFSTRLVGIVPDVSELSITEPAYFFARLTGYLCKDKSVAIIKEIPFTVVP